MAFYTHISPALAQAQDAPAFQKYIEDKMYDALRERSLKNQAPWSPPIARKWKRKK